MIQVKPQTVLLKTYAFQNGVCGYMAHRKPRNVFAIL
jgi:hypothetical protein